MIAVAGATGYVGGLLCERLVRDGAQVRALARDPDDASDLRASGCEVVEADVLEPKTLGPALTGGRRCLLPGPLDGPRLRWQLCRTRPRGG